MGRPPIGYLEVHQAANVPIWTEALFAAELVLLHASPTYYGLGVPHGGGAGVVIIQGFLCPDTYLIPLRHWLNRIGYKAYYSGIGFNAECPNLLIQQQLNRVIDTARKETGRKVHLIGHSLGGIMARSIAGQRPKDIASVITLGAPVKGMVAHSTILHAAEAVRLRIIREHGTGVLPECYTARCTCDFANSVRRHVPHSVLETAIFTEDDGIVDWRYCKTNECSADFAVRGTHIGLVFNPSVYEIVANRLSKADSAV